MCKILLQLFEIREIREILNALVDCVNYTSPVAPTPQGTGEGAGHVPPTFTNGWARGHRE